MDSNPFGIGGLLITPDNCWKLSISLLIILPESPEPSIVFKSIPFSIANFLAKGDAIMRSFIDKTCGALSVLILLTTGEISLWGETDLSSEDFISSFIFLELEILDKPIV
jgi:hypothetical protein